jgi:hypothetical protein
MSELRGGVTKHNREDIGFVAGLVLLGCAGIAAMLTPLDLIDSGWCIGAALGLAVAGTFSTIIVGNLNMGSGP